jgi:chemotaxis protein histidine kinase CheA/CheY-like chemotaxis protein
MIPSSGTASTAPSSADRLDAFADDWQHLARDATSRPGSAPALDAIRAGLDPLAREAEAEDSADWARAVRRIALLSEVWECLACEPGLGDAADGLAEFCVGAIRELARDRRDGISGGDDGAIARVLRESTERWGDYLGPLDPTSDVPRLADEPDPLDGSGIAEDDPPGLEAQALLSLLTSSGKPRSEPAAHREEEPLDPSPAARPTRADRPVPTSRADEGTAFGLEIPPLPSRIDLDDEMREAFLADAIDLFERIERIVVGLGTQDDPREGIHELCRCFHTLKGAAGSVGLKELAALVHEVEERLGHAGTGVSEGLNNLLHRVVGYLEDLIGLLRRDPDVPLRTLPDRNETSAPSPTNETDGPVRVPVSRFEELTDLASELILQGRFWLSQAGSMKSFAATAQDCRNRLLGSLDRLYDCGLGREAQTRPWLIDPRADLPDQLRRLGEQANDLAVLAGSAQAAAASMVDRGDALVRLSHQLWDALQSLRIVPIGGLFRRLARVVQAAARVEGRQVEIVVIGEDTGVDRAVQDKTFEPLLHVARNAVSHGIECPADRVRQGKHPVGRVTFEARREGNTLVIAVADDGKGLDEEAIAAKAIRLGWLTPDERPDRARLRSLIFEPGFSTRSQANDISGRGVGMDVVAREVNQLRGTIDLESQPGCGTRLALRLPARLALEPALIVRIGGQPFAIPASQVERAQPFERPATRPDAARESARAELGSAPYDDSTVAYGDQAIPVVFGSEVLGIGRPGPTSWTKLVVVRTGGRLMGMVVDEIEGAGDLVIKPMSDLLAGHPLVTGTSVSIKGEVILVLNASGLERWLGTRKAAGMRPPTRREQPSDQGSEPGRMAVLVVDDSISVRRGVARQLLGLGLEVDEVSDGLEALGRLRDSRYGLVVTDLEMPKLDGLALLAEMKRSPNLSAIPVIVASTRGDPDTRRRVLELGARALLSKPVDLVELARIVEPFLADVGG